MRLVLQRVSRAAVRVAGETIAEIGKGFLILVGIGRGDSALDLSRIARKVVELRVFEDDAGKMNLSLQDVHGEILAVSQFTLYADVRKGRRPSFIAAAPPEEADPLFEAFVAQLRAAGATVHTGRFGAKMEVELVNDGPVTILLEVAPPDERG